MRIVGLITEYNPFHNGHLHHLSESLRIADAEASVAVMSGHFLQRGEPALVNKWVRTEMALAAGVDLVLELPFPFACSSAPSFALGAVQSLNALGVVDALCFGSEAGSVEPLQEIAKLLISQREKIATETGRHLRQGVNYPTARAKVLTELAPHILPELMASPNNILGFEYLRALQQTASPIQAYTMPRLGAGYHSTAVTGAIASATGIRQRLSEGDDVNELIPEAAYQVLERELQEGRSLDPDKLLALLLGRLLQEPETLREIFQVEDGLEVRCAQAAMTATSYEGLVAAVKSRQWTLTRIQRLLSYVLMQAHDQEMRQFQASGPLYLRLLGASDLGQQVLALSRKRRQLPLFSDPAKAPRVLRRFYREKPELKALAQQMLAYDLRATRLYGLLQKIPEPGHRNRDFFQPVPGHGFSTMKS